MGISAHGKVGEIGERCASARLSYLAGRRIAANDLSDLDVEQMGRVQGFSSIE